MRVHNVHHRELPVPADVLGALLDSLAERDDRLWPIAAWPPMRFDRPLQVGAIGGHGPIRYTVESYDPSRAISFRFTGPPGFNGTHRFVVEPTPSGSRIAHDLRMRTSGSGTLSWLVVFRPLHDALLEDALHRATLASGVPEAPPTWSLWVRILRALLRSRRTRHAT
jgi:hypothetical protein